MKSSLVLLILLLVAQTASAKCIADFHVFSGVVTDKAGKPIPGAMVGVSWAEQGGPTGPALALTDSEGRYSIPVLFETYSGKGKVVEDECKQQVEVISVSASKGALRSAYEKVHIGDTENIRLPPAVIWLNASEPTRQRLLRTPSR